MRIPLAEYARRHGKRVDVARHKAQRGGFDNAVKIGRDWFIDEDEVWIDRRMKSGSSKAGETHDNKRRTRNEEG